MIGIRHCGIYVYDIAKEELFYERVFNMKYICRQDKNIGEFDFLFDNVDTTILTTKLITEKGVDTGEGDMIELISVLGHRTTNKIKNKELYDVGTIHIAFECVFDDVLPKVEKYGGHIKNGPVKMWNDNLMCIIQDPELNYIELLQRK